MQITPARIRQVAEITLTLEPVLDKQGCTTRYSDLPNRPLSDFIIAGINVGPVLEEYATSVKNESNQLIYSHLVKALMASNAFKHKKYVNFGLLAMLFPCIKARLQSTSLKETLKLLSQVIKNSSKQDVVDEFEGLKLAWSTSLNPAKQKLLEDMAEWFKPAESYYERYMILREHCPESTDSNFQFSNEFVNGFPLVKRFIQEIDESIGLLKSLENTYNTLHQESPEIRVGILADICASACFLYLSFQEESYIIY